MGGIGELVGEQILACLVLLQTPNCIVDSTVSLHCVACERANPRVGVTLCGFQRRNHLAFAKHQLRKAFDGGDSHPGIGGTGKASERGNTHVLGLAAGENKRNLGLLAPLSSRLEPKVEKRDTFSQPEASKLEC